MVDGFENYTDGFVNTLVETTIQYMREHGYSKRLAGVRSNREVEEIVKEALLIKALGVASAVDSAVLYAMFATWLVQEAGFQCHYMAGKVTEVDSNDAAS